ncbi:EthD family reductase [Altererythrobacter sp.]|uniref:EthD family reductase n=1 Tax=Altererythrobacter sp. TaxID=1872480 RepID=UPI003D06BF0E
MPNIVVSYPKSEGASFDADYYRDTHIPLAERTWAPHGLSGADILWPADDAQPFAAMVVLAFESDAAIDAAMGDPGTAEVMGDVPRFTNIQPTIYRTA